MDGQGMSAFVPRRESETRPYGFRTYTANNALVRILWYRPGCTTGANFFSLSGGHGRRKEKYRVSSPPPSYPHRVTAVVAFLRHILCYAEASSQLRQIRIFRLNGQTQVGDALYDSGIFAGSGRAVMQKSLPRRRHLY